MFLDGFAVVDVVGTPLGTQRTYSLLPVCVKLMYQNLERQVNWQSTVISYDLITGWWHTYPSENMKVSKDDGIPNAWKNKTCSKPPTR